MSFERIALGKFLVLISASPQFLVSKAREDIRNEISREADGRSASGGDFYVPFWADAKAHLSGDIDLRRATEARIRSNEGRRRLYELLQSGFLGWWNERRRLRNEPFAIINDNPRGLLAIDGLGSIKVENNLHVLVDDEYHRIVYPYFSEKVVLTEKSARIGLYIMTKALLDFDEDDMRIVDILRSRSFSTREIEFQGDEEYLVQENYRRILDTWNNLRAEY